MGRSFYENVALARSDEENRLEACVSNLCAAHDFVVIDTPGSDDHLSRVGHSYADTLITPLNDSFIDLDLLAKVDPDTHKVLRPSSYAEMVWEQRKARALRDGGKIDWIVMRNRLASIGSRNTQAMEDVLGALSKRIGFRLAPGFGERVIFRELFLKGLTLLDLRSSDANMRLNMSHVAARQEVRALLTAIGLTPAPEERPAGKGNDFRPQDNGASTLPL
jgi:chromosome partitioning protein